MSGHERQRGFSFKTVLALLVFAAVVSVGFKITFAFVNNYQLQDFINSEAKFALVNRKSAEAIRDTVFNKARDLDIPLKPEQIKVTVDSSGVQISVDYVVPIQVPGYTWNLSFAPSADSRHM